MFVIMEILKGCFDLYKIQTNVKVFKSIILLICVSDIFSLPFVG